MAARHFYQTLVTNNICSKLLKILQILEDSNPVLEMRMCKGAMMDLSHCCTQSPLILTVVYQNKSVQVKINSYTLHTAQAECL